ncbi:E3 ubiquitin-protein ligase Pep5p [[Candida] railenensis]|uniref:E3 ubiquitin-protein ligase PEP5 n=1 Tax=[Candida] railenensis TaxID=45579 RepID=A0A9P0QL55_9ASCO|nr:E3 ubiquitin-protein ligase Pep5p [[Candida] railenensis]
MSDVWRQFQLFDLTPIRDPNYKSNDPLYSDPSLSAICSTESNLLMATNNIYIRIISKQFLPVKTFVAYDLEYRINYMKALPHSNLLVTVAERQGFPSVLKLWDLTKILTLKNIDEDQYKHEYHTMCRVSNGDNAFPITTIQFNKGLSCVAVGYANGTVLLIRGDLIRDRGSKQRIIYESNEPITGIHFNLSEDLLYITTTSKILTVLTNGRNNGRLNRLLSKKTGVDLNCSGLEREVAGGELIVATQDSIRYYNHVSKTNTILLDMPKKLIHRFGKNYLLIISPQQEEAGKGSSGNGVVASPKKLLSRIVILDLLNKHISFSLTIPNNTINYVFEMWGDLYMLSSDGILFKIHEKSINQQIEIILQRNLFNIAYTLAIQNQLSKEMLLRIQRLHGEYLFDQQQDFNESINLYISCLDIFKSNGENSEELADFIMDIITKFKDVSNINNLTKFLYKLYELKLADNDHLTLLLCCYCKLKKLKELDEFIDQFDFNETSSSTGKLRLQQLNFQLIINLFKECEYYPQVVKLLYKLNQPSHIVDIQLNYLNQPQKCLQYVKTLSIDELLLILIEYSKILLDNSPIETTELLINVFTGKYMPQEENEPEVEVYGHDSRALHSGITSIPINSYKNFVTYLSGSENNDPMDGENTSLNGSSNKPSAPTYLPPRPSLIFPSFINNPNEFVVFLEACIETFDKYQGNINDKKELLMTLFEMYLSLSKDPDDEWKEKANALLSEYSTLLNKSSLLLVSHIYDFGEGEISAKEQSGGFEESLFRSSAIAGNIENCFNLVRKYGDAKPELYKLLLKFIISKEEIFDQVSDSDFKSILLKIKTLKLATPLEVIQILSSTELTTIGLIKDYLIDYIDTQNREISNNRKLIKSYESETTKIGNKLSELTTKPFIIQNNKCSSCHLKLDYPVIHFKCNHSYHQRCLDENTIISSSSILNEGSKSAVHSKERDCPLCINDLESSREVRRKQFNSKDEINLFEQSLKDKDDRFKVITDFLGKGIMENESSVIVQSPTRAYSTFLSR